jgi:hypothetical protein
MRSGLCCAIGCFVVSDIGARNDTIETLVANELVQNVQAHLRYRFVIGSALGQEHIHVRVLECD